MAKALLCEARPARGLEACGECEACVQVEAGTHPDYFRVGRPDDSLDVPIEVVRELCRGLALKPARGRLKVAVVDDADDLNDYAANCCLKTLEEPPPHSLLLLVGTSSDRQLSTLVSRCQVVRFRPLPEQAVAEILRERDVADAALVPKLARLSNGSPGQALALADPALWEFRRQLVQGLSQARVESVGLAEQWLRFVEEAGRESASQRRRAAQVLRLLIEFFRDVLCVKAGGTPKLAEPEDLHALQQLAERADADKFTQVLERCLESDLQIDRRVQLVLVVEALVDFLAQTNLAAASSG